MTPFFYSITFVLALSCTAIYLYTWHKNYDVNFTLIFTLIPISCIGYLLQSFAENAQEIVAALKVMYIGGVFLQLFMFFAILHLCQIELRRWLRLLLFVLFASIYASVLSIGYTDLFYRSYTFESDGLIPGLTKDYGVMHTVFYISVILLFAAGVAVILYSLFKKRQIPRTILFLTFFPNAISVFCYLFGKSLFKGLDILPLGYVLAQIIYLIIARRATLYNAGDTVIASMVHDRSIGFISFDFRFRYLGSNETAQHLIPELGDLAVDRVFGYRKGERRIRHFLESFKRNPENNQFLFTYKDPAGNEEETRFYNVNISYLYDGFRDRGYIITFTDDTSNRKYINLLDTYNEKLQNEVDAKTRGLIEMHDNLIMSLAMMVESRDNSTGGHIKRTSEVVRILIDELKKEGTLSLSESFCRDVIKAAPMHDLGKIAVDDAVLRKPGRFTDEEYEKMKHHAAEGARVIHEILLHTPDNSFKLVAENVAHYHHERWDGSGYPEGKKKEEIPLEARIMAVADVYDALVSKRVYKDAFSFEKADTIIKEGMGSQFDPALSGAYEKARPRLEAYYGGLSE